jgi:hypothetical protein
MFLFVSARPAAIEADQTDQNIIGRLNRPDIFALFFFAFRYFSSRYFIRLLTPASSLFSLCCDCFPLFSLTPFVVLKVYLALSF